jgi:hypothetical protein
MPRLPPVTSARLFSNLWRLLAMLSLWLESSDRTRQSKQFPGTIRRKMCHRATRMVSGVAWLAAQPPMNDPVRSWCRAKAERGVCSANAQAARSGEPEKDPAMQDQGVVLMTAEKDPFRCMGEGVKQDNINGFQSIPVRIRDDVMMLTGVEVSRDRQ